MDRRNIKTLFSVMIIPIRYVIIFNIIIIT